MNGKNSMKTWGRALEDGRLDDPLLSLAADLAQESRTTAAAPAVAFRRQLRQDLLAQYHPPARTRVVRFATRFAVVAAIVLSIPLIGLGIMTLRSAPVDDVAIIPGAISQPGSSRTEPASPATEAAELSGYELHYALTEVAAAQPDAAVEDGTGAIDEVAGPLPITVVLYWKAPVECAQLGTFVHELDAGGALLAQADGQLSPVASIDGAGQPSALPVVADCTASLELPAMTDLSGQPRIVAGIYETASGRRLDIVTPAGNLQQVGLPDDILATGTNSVAVQNSDIEPGTVITGTEPITFTIGVSFRLATQDHARLQVKLTTVEGESGRGVATAELPITRGQGRLSVPVRLSTQELGTVADLGLWLQIVVEERQPPIVADFPAEYRWRYEQ